MKYYFFGIKNFASFDGRASRSEYWYFWLYNTLFLLLTILIDSFLDKKFTLGGIYFLSESLTVGFFNIFYGILLFIPTIAVFIRRMHDINKSGWYIILFFIPIIGWVWLLILLVTAGTKGVNKFGAPPAFVG